MREPMASKTKEVGEIAKKGIYARRRLTVHVNDVTRCLDFLNFRCNLD
jgi:hypothetical protein